MAARRPPEEPSKTRRRPATTPEARENQLVALAVDLAEKQIRAGTASSQVVVHYLKLASSREKLEQLKITHENELLKAKAENIESGKQQLELFEKAIVAMSSYRGEEMTEAFNE